jgi:phytanoyl-CoA hydroxylase
MVGPTDWVASFRERGYAVIPGVVDQTLIALLRSTIEGMSKGELPLPEGAMKVLEPRVLMRQAKPPEPGAGIRRIDGIDLLNEPLIREAVLTPGILAVVRHLLGEAPRVYRTTVTLKPPRVGSPKGLHQDAASYPIVPMEYLAVWIALDRATTENGCMEVLPGVHRQGLLDHEPLEGDTDIVVKGTNGNGFGLVRLPMEPGDILVTNCLTPHRSGPNRSSMWRRALVVGYMPAAARFATGISQLPAFMGDFPIDGNAAHARV